jgi:energy-coupling factor transporter ATP-binding protein EcfA2
MPPVLSKKMIVRRKINRTKDNKFTIDMKVNVSTIIGLYGNKGVGKDTIADIITGIEPKYSKVRFGDYVRDIVTIIFDIPRDEMETTEQKQMRIPNQYIEKNILKERLRLTTRYVIGEFEENDENDRIIDMMISVLTIDHNDQYYEFIPSTVRQAMQLTGTECFRESFGNDIFIKKLFDDFKGKAVVISDLRFKNECEAVKKHGGIIFHVERRSIINDDNHISESEIDINNADIHIVNNYSINVLKDTIMSILQVLNYVSKNVTCNLLI